MISLISRIQPVAPTLASALNGPFSGMAIKFIADKLSDEHSSSDLNSEKNLNDLLDSPASLKKIKDIELDFKSEMQQLDIDVFSLEDDTNDKIPIKNKIHSNAQIILSILFLSAYFLMLAAIFYVEVSDTLNMQKGENSLMGEMQILFGVLTAGVGQILSFWFGGVIKKSDSTSE